MFCNMETANFVIKPKRDILCIINPLETHSTDEKTN
jgi:hypothetical protein